MKQAGTMIVILGAALWCGCGPKPVDDAAIVSATKAKLSDAFEPIEANQESQLAEGADKQTVTHISVQSANGVVTLTGEVQSNRAKAKAGDIAHSIAKVVRVNNNLAVAPGYSDDAVGRK